MLRISDKLEVGREYYIYSKENFTGGAILAEIKDKELVFKDAFKVTVAVLQKECEDEFKMFYSKSDYCEYERFINSTLTKLRYLETYTSNYCGGNTQVRKLLNIMLQDTID